MCLWELHTPEEVAIDHMEDIHIPEAVVMMVDMRPVVKRGLVRMILGL